jgi:hypothetical protein
MDFMKKSSAVTLTVVAGMGLAACNRQRQDPCEAATFNEQACQEAVSSGGYFWHGTWVPMRYNYPYPHYYDTYRGYVSRGGVVKAEPGKTYGRVTGAPAGHGVVRGGFGSIGAGHAVGG